MSPLVCSSGPLFLRRSVNIGMLRRPRAAAGLGAALVWLAISLAPVASPLDARARADEPPPAPPPSLWTRKRGQDWPCFLGATRDSRSSETGIQTDWSGGRPRLVWQVELGESYGICSVAGGRLFQFDRIGNEARLRCLRAETGQPLWEFRYPTSYEDLYGYNGGPRCSPLIDGAYVYLFGVEGLMHCLRAADGQLVWKVDTAARFGVVQNFFGVGSNPVVAGDLLIVMVGGSPPESQRVAPGQLDLVDSNGTAIVAFDKRTGEVRYAIGDDLASYASLQLANIRERDWCFAFARRGLLAFEPTRGTIDFHYPWQARLLESVNASTPVVVADEVLISETYGPGASLLRVAPGKQEVVWSDSPQSRGKRLQTHWNTPVFHAGHVYGCSGRHTQNAELRCLEWKTGKVMWREPELTRTSLLYVDGHFVCLGEDGVLRLLRANPARYELVAETDLRDQAALADPAAAARPLLRYPCWAAPILSHGLLYVRGDDRLVCLDLIPESP